MVVVIVVVVVVGLRLRRRDACRNLRKLLVILTNVAIGNVKLWRRRSSARAGRVGASAAWTPRRRH